METNKYGNIYGQERISAIEDIIDSICEKYPIKNTKLKIVTLNKGIIFNGYNKHDIQYSLIDSENNNFTELDNSLNDEKYKNYKKHIHIISNSNRYSSGKISELHNHITDNHIFKSFYHYLPESDNNQYISNVRLISTQNGLFHYEITIGNNSERNADLALQINKNLYLYDSLLSINQSIGIFDTLYTINSNISIIDTIALSLRPNRFMEISFNLENRNIKDLEVIELGQR